MTLNDGTRSLPHIASTQPDGGVAHCEYTSKHCANPRALKPNGQFHRLCDYHRQVANENQRRWQNRKRTIKAQDGTRHQELLRKYPKVSRAANDAPVQGGRLSPQPRQNHTLPSLEREVPTLLPRLHQHHILSRALLLPAVVKNDAHVGIDSSQMLWHSQDRQRQGSPSGLSALRPSL